MIYKPDSFFLKIVFSVMFFVQGIPQASVSIPADYTGDQKVTLEDFAVLSRQWQSSCGKEELARLSFHWLTDAAADPDVSIRTIYTDKSRYLPGGLCVITAECENNSGSEYWGRLGIYITHHGHLVHADRQVISIAPLQTASSTFSWTVLSADFEGYLVEAWLDNGSSGITAVDVSGDWKRYPRYGYVTEFYSSTSTGRNAEIMDQLSREYHINCLQYYDWMWRHEQVIQRNGSTIVDPWYDWRNAAISFSVLQDSIARANARAMAPMAYFQIYLGLDDYEAVSGVSPQWGLYSDTNHINQLYHDAGVYMWIFNPGNVDWQNHLCSQYTDALVTLNWAGIHLDQLGNVNGGTCYDGWGNGVDLGWAYGNMVNRSKDHLDYLETIYPAVAGRDGLMFNILDGTPGLDTLLAGKTDSIYTELWGNETYGGVRDYIKYARGKSGGKAVVLAAYINRYEDTGGVFDADSVLLADAAFFASGAFHLELGDGQYMLAQEFFPARDKLMDPNLQTRLRDYYHFITAYEKLLFAPDLRFGDGGLQWICATGYNLSGHGAGDTIWFLNRGTPAFELFHLINLLGHDDRWRNIAASPAIRQDIPVKLRLGPDAEVAGVFIASPDCQGGILQRIPYTQGIDAQGDYLSIIIPRLEYWDMIYIERTVTAPANDRYEAEDAVKMNVGVNTNHGGYSGSGFVDQYAEVNDSVSFVLSVPQSGGYILRFRYANGGSSATRSVVLNGDIQGDVLLTGLGGWDTWGTATMPLALEAGVHQIILYYGSWNSGAINLDYLEIQPQ